MAAGAASHPRRGADGGDVFMRSVEEEVIMGGGCGGTGMCMWWSVEERLVKGVVRGVVGTCGRNLKPSWKKGHQRQTTCVCK